MKHIAKLLIILTLLLGGIECFAATKTCVADGNKTITSLTSSQIIYGSKIHGNHLTTYIKRTGTNAYVYCIEDKASSLSKGNTLSPTGGVLDPGYAYILNNGYPSKVIVSGYGEDANYTATQLAIKMYGYLIDNSNVDIDSSGKSRFLNVFIDSSGNQLFNFNGGSKDGTNEQSKIANAAYELATEAKKAHDNAGDIVKTITVSPTSLTFGYSAGKITSGLITVTLPTYTNKVVVSSSQAVEFYDESGNKVSDGNFTSKISSGKVKFAVVIPTNTDMTVSVKVSAETDDVYCQYETSGRQDTIGTELHAGETYTKTLKGTYESTGIVISKQDLTGSKEVEGATLCLKDSSGNVVSATGLDESGCFVSGTTAKTFALNDGSYNLCETIAPTDYTLNTTCIDFTVASGKASVNGTEVEQVIMTNEAKYEVEISKTDATTGSELAGAHLVIRDSSGNIVEEWDSTETAHKVKLDRGTYTLEETIAPTGYKKKTTKITFNVPTDTKVEMKNETDNVVVPPTSLSTKKIIFVISTFLFCAGSIIIFLGYHRKFEQ